MSKYVASGEAKREPTAPSLGPARIIFGTLSDGPLLEGGNFLWPVWRFTLTGGPGFEYEGPASVDRRLVGKFYSEAEAREYIELRQRQTEGTPQHAGGNES